MVHRSRLTVRFNELDPYNHVNHAAYVMYLEVARTEALEACGIPLPHLWQQGIQLVVTRLDIRYRGAAGSGDRLEVITRLAGSRRASSTWYQSISREGSVLVEADVTIAVTDGEGRPVRPPAWLFPAMATLGSDAEHDAGADHPGPVPARDPGRGGVGSAGDPSQ